MLRIEKVFLQGFKSFCDPTEVVFDEEGITAVVGPNGCGKCVDGSTLVTLADGREVEIRKLVDEALASSRQLETLDDGVLTRENPQGIEIISLNPKTLRLERRSVTGFVKRTATPHLLRIRTRSGREVTATPYHPLFTLDHGRLRALKAEDLRVGTRVALPRRLPVGGQSVDLKVADLLREFRETDRIYIRSTDALRSWAAETRERFGTDADWARAANISSRVLSSLRQGQGINGTALTEMASVAPSEPPLTSTIKSRGRGEMDLPARFTSEIARFLGLLIAEGRNTSSNQVWFVNADPAINADFSRLSHELFGLRVHQLQYKPAAIDSLIYSRALGAVLDRLFHFKVASCSADKEVPPQVFEADASVKWAFISGLFEGDAYISARSQSGSKRPMAFIEYTTASPKLANQVISLLMQLGVFALLRVKEKAASNTAGRVRRTYYSVLIYGSDQLRYVAEHLTFVGEKRERLEVLRNLSPAANPNLDLVPSATKLVKQAARLAGLKLKPNRKQNPKLAAYVEGRCEASRSGLAEVADRIANLGASPEKASFILDRLNTLATSDIYWDEIISIDQVEPSEPWVYDLSIAETHNFVAGNLIVHNSNISDAINWVIGEQRARALRGGKMEDVIFQGSRNRQPSGMAEVLLTMVVRETFEIRSDNGRKSAGEAPAEEATQPAGEDAQSQPESPTAEETAGETSAETSAETSTEAASGTAAESESKQAESAKRRRRMTIEPASRVFQEGERITVGRRLYRTGESEYEMNGRACRLRDIQDLFAGTGLGGAHYAIIEQGRIGQVLSAKPLDRRSLIEEAAGISKFKMRQHAAELKLEASRQNLSRVNDIISEIERQQNSLKRQAARARRYQRLRQEMRDLMRAVYVCDYRVTKGALAALETDWDAASGRETAAIERIAGLEEAHSRSAQEARGAEEKLNATRASAASLDLETERARQQERYLSEQLRSLEARAEESARERETIAGRSGFIEQERARLGDELQAVEQEINAAGLALAADEDAHRAQLARDREAEEQLEAARRLLYETTTHLERWRQLCRQFDEAVDRGETRLSGLAAERERTEAQAKANDAEREMLESNRAEGEARHAEVVEQLAGIEAELGEAREVRAGCEQALATVKHGLTATEHRLKSLIELDERHACFSEAVQLLLNRAQNRDLNDGDPPPFRALGTLADFVRVAPEHEAMIETALREELQYILVPGYDDAIAAIDLLKSEGAGRASFLLAGLHGAEGPATIASSDLDGEDRQPEEPGESILDSQLAEPGDNLLYLQPAESADITPNSQTAEIGDGILDSESGEPGEDPIDPLYAPAHQAEFAAESSTASTFMDEDWDAGPGDAGRGMERTALIDLLGLQPELASIFERALPRLAGARIVETVEQAIGASIVEPNSGAEGREGEGGAEPSEIYVTRQGERVIAGRLVMGGANASSGIGVLAMKREMAELGERYESLSSAAGTAESELEAADARLRRLEERRSVLDAEQRQIEKQLAVLRTQWEQSERDRERIATHIRVIAQETAQVEKELAEQRNRLVQAAAQTEEVEREHREAEQRVASAQAEMVELRRRSEERAQELSRRRAEFAARAERRRGLQNDINRLENEARDLTDRLERSRLSTIETEEQIRMLKANLAATSEQLAALAARQQEMAAALAEENAALSAMRERLEGLDQELRATRDEATAAREERARLELERVRLTSLLDHLADSCYHELGERLSSILERLEAGTADAALEINEESGEETGARSEMIEDEEAEEADAPGLSFWQVPEDFDLAAAKARLEELRAKIDALGPINMMALDELTEVEERYRFLVAQKADIERAIADTQSAIAEIKRRSRERFAEAFAAINTNFQQMFQELFGGGRGEMRLIDETDILESGIEIIAQPPGKRLQNVLLLSGGEKAMAAISLVLAIFKYRPSPFCILDEVDAPLDEVNISRFADKVREMSAQTQFVIITHSKRTMESARTLYGVTMEDPGVSKLISVRLT